MKENFCSHCQSPIPQDAPGGLCPACALRGAGEFGPQSPHEPTPGEVAAAFPKLEIIRLIGRGGMGFVYEARQPELDRTVALKILPPSLRSDPAFEERFAREARVLGKLKHPNIVTLYEYGESGGFYYLLMEYVDGVNLRQAMGSGRFTPDQALAIVPAICDALQCAHAQGVWHRDIKPENILLDREGHVKIADFGIARILGDPMGNFTLTRTGGVLGSAPYMAPEQHEKPHDVDHRADIYSLGVVIYEMLTGELPLGRFPAPSRRVEVSARIDEIVLRTLEKERELRQQGAAEVKTEVERAGDPSAASTPPPDAMREPRFSRTAIVAGCWLAFVPLHFMLPEMLPPGAGQNGLLQVIAFLMALLFYSSPVAVVLGWVAVSQIRRSGGRLHGMWLAVAAGLSLPLLALDVAVVMLSLSLLKYFAAGVHQNAGVLKFGVMVIPLALMLVVLDIAISCRVWNAVNRRERDASPPRRMIRPATVAYGLLFFSIFVLFPLAIRQTIPRWIICVPLLPVLAALVLGIWGWKEWLGKFTVIASIIWLIPVGAILFLRPSSGATGPAAHQANMMEATKTLLVAAGNHNIDTFSHGLSGGSLACLNRLGLSPSDSIGLFGSCALVSGKTIDDTHGEVILRGTGGDTWSRAYPMIMEQGAWKLELSHGALPPPVAAQSKGQMAAPGHSTQPIEIHVSSEGVSQIAGTVVTDGELRDRLATAAKEGGNRFIRLQCASNISNQRITEIMNLCRAAGLSDIRLATVPSPVQNTPEEESGK